MISRPVVTCTLEQPTVDGDGQYRGIAVGMLAIATVRLVVLATIELAEYRVAVRSHKAIGEFVLPERGLFSSKHWHDADEAFTDFAKGICKTIG